MVDMWIKGEGGAIWPFDEPLADTIAKRLENGEITRVNEDGTPYVEDAEPVKLTPKQQLQAVARELGVDDSGTSELITERIEKHKALVAQARELSLDETGGDEELQARIDDALAK